MLIRPPICFTLATHLPISFMLRAVLPILGLSSTALTSKTVRAMSAIPTLTLNDGNKIPIIGLGTYGHPDSGDRDKTSQAVKDAIAAGYRHIDTAYVYEIEEAVGKAINESISEGVVKREELFITTKLHLIDFRRERVVPAAKKSLALLGLDYLDLYLAHWPVPLKNVDGNLLPLDGDGKLLLDDDVDIYNETWKGLEEVKKLGLAKSIGISNFNSVQIDKLLEVAKIRPVVNQVESHPFLNQRKLRDFCSERGIVLTAYSPLGGSPFDVSKNSERHLTPDVRAGLFENADIKALAAKYNKSVGQILLKFQVQRGISVIPKSVNKSRIAENASIFDFLLTAEEIEKLEGLNANLRYIAAEPYMPSKYYPFRGVEF